ncbi:methyltransferase domain-containing protein [Nocardia sp. NPDC004604]|uniref:methyltransferase domain-containing protein n=1 Tax=Nocardia sp. NPDC004604 TaxID=3157013 RepID=UPI0033B02263
MTIETSDGNNDVATFYNGTGTVPLAGKLRSMWGGNLHLGYWHDTDDDTPPDVATERLTDLVITCLEPKPGQRLLDIGCGVGKPATRLLTTHPVQVVGITISEAQVDQARARAADSGLADRARFEHADAMLMPFPDASFDGAWALESMFHMPDRAQVLAETSRVLRGQSRLAITDFVLRTPLGTAGKAVVDRMCATFGIHSISTLDEYVEQLGAHDFAVTNVRDISDNVLRTGILLADAMESVREQLVANGNATEVDAMINATREFATTAEFGYVIISAVRN